MFKVDTSGILRTFAGTGSNSGGLPDGGLATTVSFLGAQSVACDAAGNVYIADQTAQLVHRVDANGNIHIFAGPGMFGFAGDGGPAINAAFESPFGIASDAAGDLFIADQSNGRIRKVDTGGNISTIAGGGNQPVSARGAPATSVTFQADDTAVDSFGNVYVASQNRVYKVASGPPAARPSVSLVANAFGDNPLIAPNTWVEVKGSNLAPPGDSRIWQTPDFLNNQLPQSFDGVSVIVNGKPAYVYFISASQVNILTPPDAIFGTVNVQPTTGGQRTTVAAHAAAQSLSLFEFVSSTGKAYVYGRHGSDSSLIGPVTLFPGLTTPVKPGESIFIAGNGFGPTDNPVASGSLTQSGNLPGPLPVVKIGGIAASVSFAGLAGVGTYQINLVVPPNVPDGDLPIQVSYNGPNTQPNLLITVQH